jgi:adenine-specific DNA glycosylase
LAPSKAKYLSGLSKLLVERHDGVVPASFAELEALPGVGHKTASVVMAQAFGVPAFPVDTHIWRLAMRWSLSAQGANVVTVERDLKALFPDNSWATLHLQMIFFGRQHCGAKAHDVRACPICSWAAEAQVELVAPALATPRKAPRPEEAGAGAAAETGSAKKQRLPGTPRLVTPRKRKADAPAPGGAARSLLAASP